MGGKKGVDVHLRTGEMGRGISRILGIFRVLGIFRILSGARLGFDTEPRRFAPGRTREERVATNAHE